MCMVDFSGCGIPAWGLISIWTPTCQTTHIPNLVLLTQSERFAQNLELIRWTIRILHFWQHYQSFNILLVLFCFLGFFWHHC